MEHNFSIMTEAVLTAFGFSEAELARHIGVSQPTIHRIKSGAIKDPGYSTGAKIKALFESVPDTPPEAA